MVEIGARRVAKKSIQESFIEIHVYDNCFICWINLSNSKINPIFVIDIKVIIIKIIGV
jgi:hypothetical protein